MAEKFNWFEDGAKYIHEWDSMSWLSVIVPPPSYTHTSITCGIDLMVQEVLPSPMTMFPLF